MRAFLLAAATLIAAEAALLTAVGSWPYAALAWAAAVAILLTGALTTRSR